MNDWTGKTNRYIEMPCILYILIKNDTKSILSFNSEAVQQKFGAEVSLLECGMTSSSFRHPPPPASREMLYFSRRVNATLQNEL